MRCSDSPRARREPSRRSGAQTPRHPNPARIRSRSNFPTVSPQSGDRLIALQCTRRPAIVHRPRGLGSRELTKRQPPSEPNAGYESRPIPTELGPRRGIRPSAPAAHFSAVMTRDLRSIDPPRSRAGAYADVRRPSGVHEWLNPWSHACNRGHIRRPTTASPTRATTQPARASPYRSAQAPRTAAAAARAGTTSSTIAVIVAAS